jgi:uncharacterized protein YoxC
MIGFFMPEENKQNEMSAELSQKVSNIQDAVDDLSTQVKDIHQQTAEMQKQMSEMYTAIVGDKKFGHTGLVKRVEFLEDTKKKWERKVYWMYGYVFGAGTLITLFVEFIKSRLK